MFKDHRTYHICLTLNNVHHILLCDYCLHGSIACLLNLPYILEESFSFLVLLSVNLILRRDSIIYAKKKNVYYIISIFRSL